MSASDVSVLIESGDGWPVGGAIFTVTDMTGRQTGLAVADSSGRAVLKGVAPGHHTAIFTAPGFSPSATAIVVADGYPTALGTVRLERIATGTTLPEPGIWTIEPVHTMINITAQHAGISSVRGRLTSFSGSIVVGTPVEASTVTVEIDADSVDTASKMRDDHLRSPDFLNVEQYPTISYHGTGLTATGPDRWTVHGSLTMCGETRPVDLDVHYLGTDLDPYGFTRMGFRATTQLRREDFRMRFAQKLATGIALVGSTLRVDLDVEAVQGEIVPQY